MFDLFTATDHLDCVLNPIITQGMSLKPSSSMATPNYVRRLVMGDRTKEGDKTTTMCASPDSRTIFFQQGGHIQYVRTHDGEPVRKNKFTVPADSRFIISPDGNQILIWSLSSTKQKFINLIDFNTGALILSLGREAYKPGRDLCVTPDWQKVVILADTAITVWSLQTGEKLHPKTNETGITSSPPPSSQVRNTIFSTITAFHDNVRVAIAHAEKPIVMIWNILQARTERLLEGNPQVHTSIGHLEVSRDHKKLLGLSRSHALIWDVEGKTLIKTIDLSVKDDPHYCLYSPCLKATLSADWRFLFVRHNFGNALKIVHLEKGEIIKSLSDPSITTMYATTTPNGHFLITCDQVHPETIKTGKVFMTIHDLKKILKDKWGENRGQFVGTLDKHGKRTGRGKAYLPDKSVYEGNWENDERSGQGECTYQDGSVYKGEWKNDMRNGQGICTYADKSVYEGTWADDGRHGTGIMRYLDGSKYQGGWKDDRRHGYGEFWSSMGSFFKGEWIANQRQGHGLSEYTDGSRYDGLWKNDLWHGRGTLYYPEGGRYEGDFRKNKKEGKGKLYCGNGKVLYEGEWSDNMKNGQGILYASSGAIKYEGFWKDDEKAKQKDTASLSSKAVSGAGANASSSTMSFLSVSKKGSRGSSTKLYLGSIILVAILAMALAAAASFYAQQELMNAGLIDVDMLIKRGQEVLSVKGQEAIKMIHEGMDVVVNRLTNGRTPATH